MTKRITLLGSTGSIGTQSLEVVRAQGCEVFGLAANRSAELLLRQIAEFHPRAVAVVDAAAAQQVQSGLDGMSDAPLLLKGREGLAELAAMPGADIVLNAVVGVAGLAPTLAAIESGKDLALANKESLVTGGALVTDAVRRRGVHLLPGGQRALGYFSVPAGPALGQTAEQNTAHRLRRAVFWQDGGAAALDDGRGRAAAPELEHGQQDHRRQRQPDE